jgi:hypothetical protein
VGRIAADAARSPWRSGPGAVATCGEAEGRAQLL